ncbi:MAG: hypothetical protein JSR63_07895 [Proteobacteria bacterium]|nr:hypothetical protein [Pseudomonadota bacterium]
MPERVNQKSFAALLDISPAMVTKHKQKGRLVLDADGMVLVHASIARIKAGADPARGGERAAPGRDAGASAVTVGADAAPAVARQQGTPTASAASSPTNLTELNYNLEAARHKRAEAQRSELLLAKEAGELVVKKQRDDAEFGRARAAREAVMSIADRIATRVAAESDAAKCHAIIEAETRRICNMLAGETVVAEAIAA